MDKRSGKKKKAIKPKAVDPAASPFEKLTVLPKKAPRSGK